LIIPPAHLIAEFGRLLEFLAGDCVVWIKYASILSSGRCYDILGAEYDLRDPMFVGSFFTKESQALFTLSHTKDDEGIFEKRVAEFKIIRHPFDSALGKSTLTEEMLLKLWRKAACRSTMLLPPLVFYNSNTCGSILKFLTWHPTLEGNSGSNVDYVFNVIEKSSPAYDTVVVPCVYWSSNMHVSDRTTKKK
jgi:hypothetical protein